MYNLREQKTNLIFIALILFMFIYFALTLVQSSRQDELFLEENQLFTDAENLITQGRYSEAEPLLNQLLDTQMNSYGVLWYYAKTLRGLGDFNGAKDYYERALEQKPFLREKASFLYDYGLLLYDAKQYKEAKEYLTDAQKLNPQFNRKLQPILNDIETKIDKK